MLAHFFACVNVGEPSFEMFGAAVRRLLGVIPGALDDMSDDRLGRALFLALGSQAVCSAAIAAENDAQRDVVEDEYGGFPQHWTAAAYVRRDSPTETVSVMEDGSVFSWASGSPFNSKGRRMLTEQELRGWSIAHGARMEVDRE